MSAALTLNVNNITMNLGEQYQLVATGADSGNILWKSSASAVFVSNTGLLTARSTGNASVTAKLGSQIASVVVNVRTRVSGISLRPQTLSLALNERAPITATVTPLRASNKAVEWSSDNPEIVSVNKLGIVTALLDGAATITGTTVDGKFQSQVTVFSGSGNVVINDSAHVSSPVSPPPDMPLSPAIVPQLPAQPVSLNIAENPLHLCPGDIVSNVSVQGVDPRSVVWSSTDPAVALITHTDTDVNFNIGKHGTVTIMATTAQGQTVSIGIIVTDPVNVTSVVLNTASFSLKSGAIRLVKAIVEPSNATDKEVTWSSSNVSVATVTSGLVYAANLGTSTITATASDGQHKATVTVTVTAHD